MLSRGIVRGRAGVEAVLADTNVLGVLFHLLHIFRALDQIQKAVLEARHRTSMLVDVLVVSRTVVSIGDASRRAWSILLLWGGELARSVRRQTCSRSTGRIEGYVRARL